MRRAVTVLGVGALVVGLVAVGWFVIPYLAMLLVIGYATL